MASFGVCLFATEYSMNPVEFARAVEARGLDSVFFPEHTHIPASRRTPWPGGAELPKHYSHTHDPFVVLAACAAATTRIKLGFGVCLITERDPIVTAKAVASLDVLSGGRVIFGVGAGWNREEMEHHGTPFAQRWAVLRERVLAMKKLWSEDEAAFSGTHVNFEASWSYPKPVQAGGPPVWLGATSKWVASRVAEYGDGLMPIYGRAGGFNLTQLREACAARGRDPAGLTLSVFGPPPKEAALRELMAQGYSHFIFQVPCADADDLLPRLDGFAKVAEQCRS